ncbi:unnamed protein product [Phytophthora fragariaefolia]|uniref:Unnamed protein product n=1 Tax=Phytophthora fragariaefolia TaxID=1490495 RepID=A0A9W6Y852_9STRA|nr:unnamed protein product [Phytophthora fragariaefolia]
MDAHWATLEKMVSLLGEAAFAGFPNLSAEQQKVCVERFDKYESSLIAHGCCARGRSCSNAGGGPMGCASVDHALASVGDAVKYDEARQDVGSDVRRQRLRQSRLLGSGY